MVHFVIQWDLPDQKANLTVYSNKAKNDWLPTTLAHKGVIEIRNYRNPLEVTPHVAITIDFETLDQNAPTFGTVTLRDRDSMLQERVSIETLLPRLQEKLAS
jgi:glycyl-tRNA synthetase (class II)